jgi:hypothetical protein
MKKLSLFFALILVCVAAFAGTAMAEVRMGQALYAAHSADAFCVATVAMDGDVISAAILNEFQFVGPEGYIPVPNADAFTKENGTVLMSKRINNEAYSALMSAIAGATQDHKTSLEAIEAFVAGKTLAELEDFVAGKLSAEVVDAVSGATLVDTLGYIQAVIEAAKSIAE